VLLLTPSVAPLIVPLHGRRSFPGFFYKHPSILAVGLHCLPLFFFTFVAFLLAGDVQLLFVQYLSATWMEGRPALLTSLVRFSLPFVFFCSSCRLSSSSGSASLRVLCLILFSFRSSRGIFVRGLCLWFPAPVRFLPPPSNGSFRCGTFSFFCVADEFGGPRSTPTSPY